MKIFGALAIALLAGCATTAPQTKAVLATPPTVAKHVEIPNVPFIEQSAGHCGPATLAMAMEWAGHPIAAEELASRVMTPAMKGSLQEDLIGASRREGMMAVKITGMSALLSELDAGHPVIIFENLGLPPPEDSLAPCLRKPFHRASKSRAPSNRKASTSVQKFACRYARTASSLSA